VGVIRILAGWVCAVVAAAVLGSMIQTQYNLGDLVSLGVEIDPGTGFAATGHDLVHFAPLYAALVGAAFAIAWPVAAALAKRRPGLRRWLFGLAGVVAVAVMLLTMNAALPITPVAATRHVSAIVLMSLAGGAAGLLYARLVQRRGQSESMS
jgi:hypothetical protein